MDHHHRCGCTGRTGRPRAKKAPGMAMGGMYAPMGGVPYHMGAPMTAPMTAPMAAPWAMPWVMGGMGGMGGMGCPGMMGKPMGHWPMGAAMLPMGGCCPGAYTSEAASIV